MLKRRTIYQPVKSTVPCFTVINDPNTVIPITAITMITYKPMCITVRLASGHNYDIHKKHEETLRSIFIVAIL